MAADTSGKLEKIKIESYSDAFYRNKNSDEFTAMFNPEKYSFKYEVVQNKKSPAGTSPTAPSFVGMKQKELDLEFVLDGTGAAGDTGAVTDKVAVFLRTAYQFKSDTHKPYYLRISWGNGFVFDCVFQSADINYTLFKPDGTPLRARIVAKFIEFINDTLRARKDDLQSPDITHVVRVPAKERIDYLSFQTYDDEQYYIDVATFNSLNNFRKLKLSSQLIFPPLV